MNRRLVWYLLGKLQVVEIGLRAPALLTAYYYGEDLLPLWITMAALLVFGLPMMRLSRPPSHDLHAMEGFMVVGLAWVLMSLFGAMPFMLSGTTPLFWDAYFETVSGFTTTGASVLPFVEGLPRGILFWRSFTHWVGGMGVLMLTLALMSKLSGRSAVLARAESPGPSFSKLLPLMADTSRVLYLIYASLTIVLTVALMASGMPMYDSVIHGLGTAGTGGFSNRNLSVGAYNNPVAEVLIMVFMLMFGTLIVSIDGNDFITSFSAVASCLSNIGLGLSLVGPHGNYGHFSPFIKFFLSILMLAGRLEFFPLLVLFHPDIWKKN